ncbi:MAG: hypothetical protein GW854_06960 [Erythrobacter sp.]|nr:hypothetical protein [Erythrobacter sp.]
MTLIDTLFAAQDLSHVLMLAMAASAGLFAGIRLARDRYQPFQNLLGSGVLPGMLAALAVLEFLPLGQPTLTVWSVTGLMLTGGMLFVLFSETSRNSENGPIQGAGSSSSDKSATALGVLVSMMLEILPYGILLGVAAATSASTALIVTAVLVTMNMVIGSEAVDKYRVAHMKRMDQTVSMVILALVFIILALVTFWSLHELGEKSLLWIVTAGAGFLLALSARALLRERRQRNLSIRLALSAFVGGFAVCGLVIGGIEGLSRQVGVSDKSFEHASSQIITETDQPAKGTG